MIARELRSLEDSKVTSHRRTDTVLHATLSTVRTLNMQEYKTNMPSNLLQTLQNANDMTFERTRGSWMLGIGDMYFIANRLESNPKLYFLQ